MKKFQFLMLALMVGMFVGCGDSGETTESTETGETTENTEAPVAETYNVQSDASQMMWVGVKDAGNHFGTFGVKGGSLEASEAGITGGTINIDISAITVEDDMPADKVADLTGHLSSADFFDTENNPEATLEITGSEPYAGAAPSAPEGLPEAVAAMFVSNPTHTIMGKLTVKGETNDISFPAKVSMEGGNLNGSAFITFDRREYGLRFMSDTENNVHPEVHVAVALAASK